ncbi:hypothetical protein BKA62DRAFT_678710 [Auriculariales sp. MPI-PUGE-AT-0066]|nr:hypothetical protein BKA62DRAFT_678710 [Auriculariales sp. MPI-PUGE-AT-0066]
MAQDSLGAAPLATFALQQQSQNVHIVQQQPQASEPAGHYGHYVEQRQLQEVQHPQQLVPSDPDAHNAQQQLQVAHVAMNHQHNQQYYVQPQPLELSSSNFSSRIVDRDQFAYDQLDQRQLQQQQYSAQCAEQQYDGQIQQQSRSQGDLPYPQHEQQLRFRQQVGQLQNAPQYVGRQCAHQQWAGDSEHNQQHAHQQDAHYLPYTRHVDQLQLLKLYAGHQRQRNPITEHAEPEQSMPAHVAQHLPDARHLEQQLYAGHQRQRNPITEHAEPEQSMPAHVAQHPPDARHLEQQQQQQQQLYATLSPPVHTASTQHTDDQHQRDQHPSLQQQHDPSSMAEEPRPAADTIQYDISSMTEEVEGEEEDYMQWLNDDMWTISPRPTGDEQDLPTHTKVTEIAHQSDATDFPNVEAQTTSSVHVPSALENWVATNGQASQPEPHHEPHPETRPEAQPETQIETQHTPQPTCESIVEYKTNGRDGIEQQLATDRDLDRSREMRSRERKVEDEHYVVVSAQCGSKRKVQGRCERERDNESSKSKSDRHGCDRIPEDSRMVHVNPHDPDDDATDIPKNVNRVVHATKLLGTTGTAVVNVGGKEDASQVAVPSERSVSPRRAFLSTLHASRAHLDETLFGDLTSRSMQTPFGSSAISAFQVHHAPWLRKKMTVSLPGSSVEGVVYGEQTATYLRALPRRVDMSLIETLSPHPKTSGGRFFCAEGILAPWSSQTLGEQRQSQILAKQVGRNLLNICLLRTNDMPAEEALALEASDFPRDWKPVIRPALSRLDNPSEWLQWVREASTVGPPWIVVRPRFCGLERELDHDEGEFVTMEDFVLTSESGEMGGVRVVGPWQKQTPAPLEWMMQCTKEFGMTDPTTTPTGSLVASEFPRCKVNSIVVETAGACSPPELSASGFGQVLYVTQGTIHVILGINGERQTAGKKQLPARGIRKLKMCWLTLSPGQWLSIPPDIFVQVYSPTNTVSYRSFWASLRTLHTSMATAIAICYGPEFPRQPSRNDAFVDIIDRAVMLELSRFNATLRTYDETSNLPEDHASFLDEFKYEKRVPLLAAALFADIFWPLNMDDEAGRIASVLHQHRQVLHSVTTFLRYVAARDGGFQYAQAVLEFAKSALERAQELWELTDAPTTASLDKLMTDRVYGQT